MTAAGLPFVTLAFVLGLLLAAYRLLRGPSAPGLAQLRLAERDCPKDFVEYAGAVTELRRWAK